MDLPFATPAAARPWDVARVGRWLLPAFAAIMFLACGESSGSDSACFSESTACAPPTFSSPVSNSASTRAPSTSQAPSDPTGVATLAPNGGAPPEPVNPTPTPSPGSPSTPIETPAHGGEGGQTNVPSGRAGSDSGGGSDGVGGQNSAMGGAVATAGRPNDPSQDVTFDACRFHFGVIDAFARDNPQIAEQIDYFTPGWMGARDTFDQAYVCDDTEPGGPLEGKVPVVVAYVAAFYAKRHDNLNDCNVAAPDLCQYGAQFIKQNLSAILDVYDSYAQGYANCYGVERPIIFEMEPDYYQYTYDSQTDPMSPAEAGQVMGQFVNAIRQHLPNAVFSLDISPWVAPNNGEDGGQQWFSNFDMSLFTFVNTSGGGTDASATRIRSSNEMTWAGVHQASGKPILADTGYGVNGSSAGHDQAWDDPNNINARIADGVVGIAQYNPDNGWGSTIAGIRGQLATPSSCP